MAPVQGMQGEVEIIYQILGSDRQRMVSAAPCLLRSPFPGNGISGPEKNAQKRPADCNDAVSENEPSHRSPPIRGLSYTFRKSPVACDWVVGPGVGTHANLVNGLRVKQLQKAPLNANGFLSKCQNWSDTF